VAKLSILAGSTSQSVNVFIQNSSVTTGAGLTGLLFNSAGLKAYYTFTGANATATVINLATLAAVNSAYSSGGFIEVDATNMPGVYRLDIPNAALATSKGRSVVIMLSGATNMAPNTLEIELTAIDNQTTNFGLVTTGFTISSVSGSVGSVTGSVGSVTGSVGSVTGAVGSVTGNVGGNVTGSVGSVVGAVGSVTGNVGGNVVGSVASVTGNVAGSVGSVATAVAITSNVKKNQALTAFTFVMTDSTTHAPKTGVSVTATRSLDGAAFSACANPVSEISNGWYQINLANTDTNANVVSLRFTGASSDDRDIQIVTQP
jgi:hypothetical protein